MPKFVWALIIGGIITYFVHKTHKAYTWVAAVLTAAVALWMWKNG